MNRFEWPYGSQKSPFECIYIWIYVQRVSTFWSCMWIDSNSSQIIMLSSLESKGRDHIPDPDLPKMWPKSSLLPSQIASVCWYIIFISTTAATAEQQHRSADQQHKEHTPNFLNNPSTSLYLLCAVPDSAYAGIICSRIVWAVVGFCLGVHLGF